MSIISQSDSIKSNRNYIIHGYVTDSETGEHLNGVVITEENTNVSTITNNYGFYSIKLSESQIKLNISYIGYRNEIQEQSLLKNTELNIPLLPLPIEIKEVIITDKNTLKQVESSQMGVNELQMKNLKSIPVLAGENDIIKTMQLLPGVQQGSEGSSSLYIRGGSSDQNLILLDEASVYNINHLFGFMSTFNDDAIQSATVLKGGIPARYGGRLSSVVDVRMKEGNNQNVESQGSIGTIASRFTISGPIVNNKTSFMFSARRSYFDLLTRPLLKLMELVNGEQVKSFYYFQDYNLKVNHIFSSNSRLFFSIYTGNDVISDYMKTNHNNRPFLETYEFNWGNITATTRWNYKFGDRLFSNFTLIYSQYMNNAHFNNSWTDTSHINYKDYGNFKSGIRDYSAKSDFYFYINSNHTFRFGSQSTLHIFYPGNLFEGSYIQNFNNTKTDTSINLKAINLAENELYLEDEMKIGNKWRANLGLRYCQATVENKTYNSIQPRLSLSYLIAENWSVKAALCNMNQNMNLLTGSSSNGLPMDLWIPTTGILKPQSSKQYSVGSVLLFNSSIEFITELFYKNMQNVLDYRDGTSYVFADKEWQSKIVQGNGIAYGAEFMAEKKTGNTFGWFNYTWSKSLRQFNEIDNGQRFPYQYHRTHNINFMVVHRFSEKFEIGAIWVFSSGRFLTVNNQKYSSYLEPRSNVETYTNRSNFEAPAYHRLDVNLRFSKQKKWGVRTWSIGCYNLYNRQNPSIVYVSDNKVHQLAIMPIIPSVSYNYKFGMKRVSSIKPTFDIPVESTPIVEKKDTFLKIIDNKIQILNTNKGNRIVGLNFNISLSSTSKSILFNLTSAKFVLNNLAIGSSLGYTYNKYFVNDIENTIQTINYGFLSRYYIGKYKIKPFVQIIPGLKITSQETLSFNKFLNNGLGVACFLADRIALEALLSNDYNQNAISFRIGFQIYFSKK